MVPLYDGRVSILGFVDDMEQHMLAADLLLLRASPNAVMEAVVLCRPFVVTGSFAGQEAKNPAYVEHEGLGVRCMRPSDLPDVVSGLLADGGAKLQELRVREAAYRNPDAARDMAAAIMDAIGQEAIG
jgi:processive 1,2-diacylglycerol beta-glucosyltransferase